MNRSNLNLSDMKLKYTKINIYPYLVLLVVAATLTSCGTTQTVASSDDGVYNDEPIETEQRRVIVADQETYDDYEENYFTKEVERLGVLNGTDIFTDIENYKSEDSEFEVEDDITEEEPDTRITYNSNAPWGYNSNSNDVVININTSPYWGYYNNWDWDWNWGWNSYYGYNYPWWRYNYGWWRNRYWHGGFYGNNWGWGWNNYNNFNCSPYYRYGYHRPYYGYYNNSYYRRGANPYRAVASRRNYNSARNYTPRATSSRRSSNVYRDSRDNDRYIRSNSRTRTTRDYQTGGHKPTRSVRGTKTRTGNYSTGGVKPSRDSKSYDRRNDGNSTRSYNSSRSRNSDRSYNRDSSNRSNRSYTPSRSNSSSRSYTPSRSSSSSSRSSGTTSSRTRR